MQRTEEDVVGEVGGFISKRFAFGISTSAKRCIAHLGGRRLLYSAGRHLVILHPPTNQVQFIESEEHTLQIAGVAVSTNQKYVACIEQTSPGVSTQVSVYSVQHAKRVKTIPLDKLAPGKENAPIDVSFSASAKLLIVQKGAPDWEIQAWRWYSGKVVACGRAEQEVTAVECNPWEEGQVVAVGPQQVKVLRVDCDLGQVKAVGLLGEGGPLLQGALYLPGGALAVASASGGISIYSASLKLEQHLAAGTAEEPLVLIVRRGRGLVSGTAAGTLQLWDLGDKADTNNKQRELQQHLRCVRELAVPLGQHRLCGVSASDADKEIAAVGSGGQLLVLSMEELAAEEEQPVRTLLLPQDPELGLWKLVGGGFHGAEVVGMDTAVQQPWLVSAAADKVVRIWSWPARSCFCIALMPDDIVSCAMHPSGMMVLVGMVNKLRLAAVLKGELETLAELPVKKAAALRFSHGGHLFAAAGRTNHIEVFSTYTQRRVSPGTGMKGHVSTVTGLSFSADDRRLVSVGAGGAVYFWDLATFNRIVELEHVDKKCIYHGVAFYNKSPGAVVRTYDGRIQQVAEGALQYQLRPGGGGEYAPVLLVAEDRVLLAASTSGVVTAMGWPRGFPLDEGCKVDHRPHHARLHGSAIISMAYLSTSPLQGILFTAGADGVVMASQVGLVIDGRAEDVAEEAVDTDAVLLHRTSEVEALRERIRELALHLTHMRSATEYQTMRREGELKERIQALEESGMGLRIALDQKAAELEATRIAAMEREEAVVRELEAAHTRLAEEVEALWERRLEMEREKARSMGSKATDSLLQMQEAQHRLTAAHQQEVQKIRAEWTAEVAREQQRFGALSAEKAEQQALFEEMVVQTELDFDDHAAVQAQRREAWAAASEEERIRSKADNSLLKKTNILLKGQKMQDLKRIGILSSENADMRDKLCDTEVSIKKLSEEIQERDAVISSNYHTIQLLRRRLQDLEKHKFVLAYKAETYHNELQPKQEALQDLQNELEEHDKQLVAGLASMRDLQVEVSEKDGYIRSLKHELLDSKSRIAAQNLQLNSFSTDLFQAMQEADDRTARGKSRRQAALEVLYNKYCFNGAPKAGDGNVEAELQRHLHMLELQGGLLERRMQTMQQEGRGAVRKQQHHNSVLLHDLGDVVQQNHRLSAQLAEAQQEVAVARQRYRLVHKYLEAQDTGRGGLAVRELLAELHQMVDAPSRVASAQGGGEACSASQQSSREGAELKQDAKSGPHTRIIYNGLSASDGAQVLRQLVSGEQRRIEDLSAQLAKGAMEIKEQLQQVTGLQSNPLQEQLQGLLGGGGENEKVGADRAKSDDESGMGHGSNRSEGAAFKVACSTMRPIFLQACATGPSTIARAAHTASRRSRPATAGPLSSSRQSLTKSMTEACAASSWQSSLRPFGRPKSAGPT